MSDIKVLKQPEAIPGVGGEIFVSAAHDSHTAPSGVGQLLKGLGLAPPTAALPPAPGAAPVTAPHPAPSLAFPSPLEFVRNAYSEDQASGAQQPPETQDVTMLVEKAENGEMDWRTCLETIINMDSSNMDQETFGVYGVNVEDKEVNLLIEVSQAGVIISDGVRENTTVSVRISSSDLAGILKGSLPPLQAYLTGRISTTGDIRKLMLFEKISNRARKPGSTFCL